MVEFEELTTGEALCRIRTIADDIWPKTFAAILSPAQIAYMMKMMYAPEVMQRELDGGYSFEIVRIDGRDAGYIVTSPWHPDGVMKLHKLYLLEEFHSRGIGQEMLRHAAERARERGFRTLLLAVNKQNERAMRAYRRAGFIIAEAVKCDIGGGFFMDDYLMRRELL